MWHVFSKWMYKGTSTGNAENANTSTSQLQMLMKWRNNIWIWGRLTFPSGPFLDGGGKSESLVCELFLRVYKRTRRARSPIKITTFYVSWCLISPQLPSCLTEHPHPTTADRIYQLGDRSGRPSIWTVVVVIQRLGWQTEMCPHTTSSQLGGSWRYPPCCLFQDL